MTHNGYLPFADFFQSLGQCGEIFNFDPNYKQIYQPIFVKGVKKIQSYENFIEMPKSMTSNAIFKKINSVDNFIPEELDYDLNPLFVQRDANHARITYSEVNKARNLVNKKKLAGEVDFRTKYKTEVCKYWAAYGYCEFGDQCAFAHGKQEIREKVHISTNYKTKKCIQFHENLYCPYGQRCQFLHSLCNIPKERQAPEEEFSYMREIENSDQWIPHNSDCICCNRRGRLPTFESFTDVSESSGNTPTSREEVAEAKCLVFALNESKSTDGSSSSD